MTTIVNHLLRTETRLVTLTGLSGVGKTHLARAAASTAQTRFAHGAWFVDLTGITDPSEILGTVTRQVGLGDYGARPLLSQLQMFIARRRMLLLLDAVEHGAPVAAIVNAPLEAAHGLKILATSMGVLGLTDEVQVPVRPLAAPRASASQVPDELSRLPAVAMFVERAHIVRPELEVSSMTATAIAGIVRALAGVPLAIELAAARLDDLTLDELAAEIDRDVDPGPNASVVLQRHHHVLRAVFEKRLGRPAG